MGNYGVTEERPVTGGSQAVKSGRSGSSTIPPGEIKLGYGEYAVLPEDGKLYEIIEGDLYVNPVPRPRHQDISRDLGRRLLDVLQDQGKGKVYFAPIDVVLDKHTIVQPDLIFIRKESLHIIGKKYIKDPPDLIVEIISPSSRRTDVLVKSKLYAKFGVPFYWIVDPDIDRIEVFHLREGKYHLARTASRPELLELEEFPGLSISLDDVFENAAD